MANTPHMSLRVPEEQRQKWRENCDEEGIDVSWQIRRLMDAWCYSRSLEKEARELLQMEQP